MRRHKPGPVGRALVAALLLASLTAFGAVSHAARRVECSTPGRFLPDFGGWTRIVAPQFPSGSPVITAYAVEPSLPDRMFVTNGVSLMRSEDAGCEWAQVWSVGDLPIGQGLAGQAAIRSIEIAPSQGVGGDVYLVVSDLAGSGPPHVIVSRDGGEKWTSADVGLPPSGTPKELLIAPSKPDVMYLWVEQAPTLLNGTSPSTVFVTRDGGATWLLSSDVTKAAAPPPPFTDIAVDPIVPESLWAATRSGLFRSRDGGGSWSAIPEVTDVLNLLDVIHVPGYPARVLAFEAEGSSVNQYRTGGPSVHWSDDDGATWNVYSTPGSSVVTSVAHGRGMDDIVLSLDGSGGRFYRFDATRDAWITIRNGGSAAGDLSLDAAGPTVYARASDSLLRLDDTKEAALQEEVVGRAGSCNQGNLPIESDPDTEAPPLGSGGPGKTTVDLSASVNKIVLDPRETARVDYRLLLPPRPQPLDVFFLLDTTSSMVEELCGLKVSLQRLVRELGASGVKVNFGLGEFKDYPSPIHPHGVPDAYPYRMVRNIGPADEGLAEAFQSLRDGGGGTQPDIPEAALQGLYQAATGDGQDLPPVGVVSPGDTAPGQGSSGRRAPSGSWLPPPTLPSTRETRSRRSPTIPCPSSTLWLAPFVVRTSCRWGWPSRVTRRSGTSRTWRSRPVAPPLLRGWTAMGMG